MKINLGTTERIIRAVLGLVLIGLAVTNVIGVWGWIGVVLVATAGVSFCPIWAMLGISTVPKDKAK